ncbi:MAG TPA: hypothetical protein V6D22_24315 [Candidatus Obscuribacterales bacterium]
MSSLNDGAWHDQPRTSRESEQCLAKITRDWAVGVSNGRDETCRPDGTLVRYRSTDSVGRPTVEQQVAPDGSQTFWLKLQGVKASFDPKGHLLAFSDANHAYTFDPAKQEGLAKPHERYELPNVNLFMNEAGKQKTEPENPGVQSLDIGQGVIASRLPDGGVQFQLPDDGARIVVDQHEKVTKLAEAGKYEYRFGPTYEYISSEDTNVPKDARLNDPVAVHDDAVNALTAQNQWQSAQLRSEAEADFAHHLLRLPEDKRLEYVQSVKLEVDSLEKNKSWGSRRTLKIKEENGHLNSVSVGDILHIPTFSNPNVLLFDERYR